ncbi:hypothetical protein [Flavobacterium sp.]|uniref:hypothetical protein n=1 Tax=Flavobacterium sp. TaxID=239 RepID=UPI00286B0706|nr:hypothetical protein [Flavobacterium sp.]
MRKILIFLIAFCVHQVWGQTEWHVRPYANNYTNPSGPGIIIDGTSFATAWCLQYALSGAGGAIHAGDIVWLHGVDRATYVGTPNANMVYKGHFKSTIVGGDNTSDYITVSSFPGEWAVIDGNIHNNPETQNPIIGGNSPIYILEVSGGNVRFENFEITCLGNFSRLADFRTVSDPFPNGIPADPPPALCNNPLPPSNRPPFNFHEYVGIQHPSIGSPPIRNEFRNLVIRNIPGIALTSWKKTLDSEIYGNIFLNNGVIEVFGFPCFPDFEAYVSSITLTTSGTGTNCRGHQTAIYTQNDSDDILKKRIIRNNIFLNSYDSGIGIWSASEASVVNYLKNYTVSKNVLVNNGSPVTDETANMIISTNAGTATSNNSSARNIDVDSNVFYRNKLSKGTAGILVKGSENINITNNLIFGYTGMELNGESNHKITFRNNLFAGSRMNVITSVDNYKLQGYEWNMNNNIYYTRPGDVVQNAPPAGGPFFYKVPQIPFNPNSSATRFIAMNNVVNDQNISLNSTWFRLTSEYGNVLNSINLGEQNSTRLAFVISWSYPSNRILINQNKYNPNKFYVSVYNSRESNTPYTINFNQIGANYGIPNDMQYRISDVQNYFHTSTNNYPATGIILPNHDPTNFELPLPATGTIYGAPYASVPIHSNIDFNTYVIEFECPGLEYNLTKNNYTDIATSNFEARNRITFGTAYTANSGANVTAIAEKEIRIIGDSWIKNGAIFLGRINPTLCSIPLNTALESGSYNTNPDNIQPSGVVSPQDPPFIESRIRLVTNDGTLKLFPNPNNGRFNIENGTSKTISKVVVNRIDSGKLVFSNDYDFQENIIIDISHEHIGLFTVQIFFEDGDSKVIKIIKQ